jgi:hypothetical protein
LQHRYFRADGLAFPQTAIINTHTPKSGAAGDKIVDFNPVQARAGQIHTIFRAELLPMLENLPLIVVN